MPEDGSMQEHLDQVVLATVRPLSLGFGFYIAYTAFRERNDYTGSDWWFVVGADITVAIYLLALAAWTWLGSPPLHWANGLGASVAFALAGTDMVTAAVNGIPAFPATALVLAGLGAVVLSWRWMIWALSVIWLAWLAMAIMFTPSPWDAQFTLQVATVLGLAIHWGRMKAYGGLIAARLSESVARSRLQGVNEELDRFAAVVAHDLQIPVSAIRLKAAALRIRAPEDDLAQRQTLAELDRVADGMSKMINGLLAYARAGQATVIGDGVDLKQIIGDVEGVFADQMHVNGGSIEVGDLPTVPGDPTLLFQLFENLIGNAIAHRRPDEPPKIMVHATRQTGQVGIVVRDNGRGFDPAEAERLFLPFERGDVEVPGHGLGLATCRRIAEQHGGRIEATAILGTGATFTVWLPTVPASALGKGEKEGKRV